MRGLVCGLVLASSAVAHADDGTLMAMERRWPTLPAEHSISFEDQLADHLSDLGNKMGNDLDLLSHDMVRLHVDGRGQRARIGLGGGNPHYLTFKLDSDWHFTDGKAHVRTKLQLAVRDHEMDLELPDMDVSTDSYHGQQMVQVNITLLQRRF